MNPINPSGWPEVWSSFTAVLRKTPVVTDDENGDVAGQLAAIWCGRAIGAVLALLPLEAVES